MYENNLAVLRGTVSSEPRRRTLPSGSVLTQVEITTPTDDGAVTVPVVVHERDVRCAAGDDVVVVGHVRRRFFRAGGVTQSRTEVVADDVLRTSRRRTVARLLAQAAESLTPAA